MTTVLILSCLAIILGMVLFRNTSTGKGKPETFYPVEKADNLSEPIISYSVGVADIQTQQVITLRSPADYPNHYGILNGQHIELHWNVLNADFISIDGIGYVQAVGKKSLFPVQHTRYKISARNRNFSASQEIVVHVFPVPVMDTLFSPLPDLTRSTIELKMEPIPLISKPPVTAFPSMQIPAVSNIRKNIISGKPVSIPLQKGLLQINHTTPEYRSFKTRLFDRMEKQVQKNYKLTDIIRTIRKHYE